MIPNTFENNFIYTDVKVTDDTRIQFTTQVIDNVTVYSINSYECYSGNYFVNPVYSLSLQEAEVLCLLNIASCYVEEQRLEEEVGKDFLI